MKTNMQKIRSVLRDIFIFGSLWVSVFAILERLRFFSYAQTFQGLQIYKTSPNEGAIGGLITAFFISVIILYFYKSKNEKE